MASKFFALYTNPYVVFAFRLIVGCYFLFDGLAYVFNAEAYANLFINYDLLPISLAPVFALTIPWLNVALGAMLIIGYHPRFASFLVLFSLAVTFAAVFANGVREADMATGAFALFGLAEPVGIFALIRLAITIGITLPLFFAKRHFLALDTWLQKTSRQASVI